MRPALALVVVAACGGAKPTAATTPGPPHAAAAAKVDPYANAPLQFQILLDDRLAKASELGELAAELTVSPKRLAVISDHKRLYLVGWGGIAPIDAALDAFDYTPDGLLLAVRGSELAYLDDSGALTTMLALPDAGMGIAAGATTVFVFDRKPAGSRYALYELSPGRTARKLLESPEPIDAVAQAGAHTFFASAGIAFEASAGSSLRPIAALPGGAKVRSLAATADGRRLYVSDGEAVYAIEGDHVTLITRSLGGVVRMQGDALLVLDPRRRVLERIVGL